MKAVKTILIILVSIGLIWLVVLLFSKAFSPTSSTTSTSTVQQKSLSSYATTDAVTAMYIDGPVRVNQEHMSLRISVSRSQTQAELIRGFDGQVEKQEVFENNSESYTNFLKSLDKAQFDRAVKKTISKDERGFCPLRNRFVYTIDQGSKSIFRGWTSTCGIGNFAGNQTLVRQLFLMQIPSATLRDLLSGSNLSTN